MSEKKELRKVSEIQQEYQGLCVKAGHLNYQIFTLKKDLELVNNTLRDLNFEAAESQAAEKASQEPKESQNG